MADMNELAGILDELDPIEETPEEEEQQPVEEETHEEQEDLVDEEEVEETHEGEEDEGPYALSDLAETLEVEQAELYDVLIPIADGEDPIPLSKLKDTYQDSLRVTRDKEAFETEKSQFLQQKQEILTVAGQAVQQVQNLSQDVLRAQSAMDMVAAEYNSVDWKELEEDDAGRAALKKQELEQRFQQASGMRAQAVQAQAQAYATAQKIHIQSERAMAVQKNPDWKDPEKFRSFRTTLTPLMQGYGFSEADVGKISDHRVLLALKDLVELKAQVDGSTPEEVKKKLKNTAKSKRTKLKRLRKPMKRAKQEESFNQAKSSRDIRVKTQGVSDLLNSLEET